MSGSPVAATRVTPTQGRALILIAAACWSTAGLGQRELEASAATQVAGRAAFAAVTLLVLTAALSRGRLTEAFRSIGRWGVAFAVLMAISSGSFMLSLSFTSVANVLFLQAAAPMLAAVLGWALVGDVVPPRTWLAIAVAALGVSVMVAASLDAGARGTIVPIVMTASFAGVVVIARHRAEVSMLPATALSQVLVVVAVLPFASLASVASEDVAILAALGIGQMGLALAFLAIGARAIPAAEVALLSLLEVVLGPLWVWLAYDERPANATLAGGAIVLAALILQATTQPARDARADVPAAVP
jgi:drug/metabolite transporter (DMT)-like permease